VPARPTRAAVKHGGCAARSWFEGGPFARDCYCQLRYLHAPDRQLRPRQTCRALAHAAMPPCDGASAHRSSPLWRLSLHAETLLDVECEKQNGPCLKAHASLEPPLHLQAVFGPSYHSMATNATDSSSRHGVRTTEHTASIGIEAGCFPTTGQDCLRAKTSQSLHRIGMGSDLVPFDRSERPSRRKGGGCWKTKTTSRTWCHLWHLLQHNSHLSRRSAEPSPQNNNPREWRKHSERRCDFKASSDMHTARCG
jgi:hypothetical protein